MTKPSTATKSTIPQSAFKQKLQQIITTNRAKLPQGSNEVFDKTERQLDASNILQTSLNVGAYVADFELNSSWCNAKNLYELLKTGPVVLSFYRGYWCSYCRAEIEEYDKLMNQLMNCHPSEQVHYLALTGQQVFNQNIDQRHYHLIIDKQLKIARQFGLVYEQPKAEQKLFARLGMTLSEVNKSKLCELPLPGVYIINQQRKVEYRYISTDFRDRQDPREIIHHLNPLTPLH